ncbi:LPS export ABC transporter periplasmic protein LptC [Candidatus Desantisbacteria bacterium]|nr:LPS export ABC transporter periplasmic protein LptC [Candidatus Desantisbacteria bacterium]
MKTYKAFIVFLLFFLFSCNSNSNNLPISKTKEGKTEPSLHIEGFTLTETLKGAREWELKARSADIYENKKIILVAEIEMIFYDKDKIFSQLKAAEAEIGVDKKDILTRGNVRITSSKNIVLETDKLNWDAKEHTFKTDSYVKVVKDHSVLTGNGLITDPNLENIKILKDVEVKTVKEEAFHFLKKK